MEGDSSRIVLVRATQQQAEAHVAQERADKIARIHAAAGFAAVFDAMRASGKPCVGHNCMFDISYGLFSFADSYLPATWTDYKTMVRAGCVSVYVCMCVAGGPGWCSRGVTPAAAAELVPTAAAAERTLPCQLVPAAGIMNLLR